MAFPWLLESNFEAGTNAEWTSETDTDSVLDIAHVSKLAQHPFSQAAPFRGAYAARVQLAGGTNDATLTSTSITVADQATIFARFYLYFGSNFLATAQDVVNVFEFQQGGGTVEATFGIRANTDGSIEVGIGDGTAPSNYATPRLTTNRWYCIELKYKHSSTGAGTFDLFVDGVNVVALTTLTGVATVGQGVLGIQNQLATTTGLVLFDQVVFDDARIYPIVDRYPTQMLLTKSGHVFVGPGIIENITLMAGAGTDNVASVFDTSRGNTNDSLKVGVELKNVTNSDVVDPAGMPIQVKRGAYVVLSGTNPRAMVNIRWAPGYGTAAVRRLAPRLKVNPLEVL